MGSSSKCNGKDYLKRQKIPAVSVAVLAYEVVSELGKGFGGGCGGVDCGAVLSFSAIHPMRQVALGFCLNVRGHEDQPMLETKKIHEHQFLFPMRSVRREIKFIYSLIFRQPRYTHP